MSVEDRFAVAKAKFLSQIYGFCVKYTAGGYKIKDSSQNKLFRQPLGK